MCYRGYIYTKTSGNWCNVYATFFLTGFRLLMICYLFNKNIVQICLYSLVLVEKQMDPFTNMNWEVTGHSSTRVNREQNGGDAFPKNLRLDRKLICMCYRARRLWPGYVARQSQMGDSYFTFTVLSHCWLFLDLLNGSSVIITIFIFQWPYRSTHWHCKEIHISQFSSLCLLCLIVYLGAAKHGKHITIRTLLEHDP